MAAEHKGAKSPIVIPLSDEARIRLTELIVTSIRRRREFFRAWDETQMTLLAFTDPKIGKIDVDSTDFMLSTLEAALYRKHQVALARKEAARLRLQWPELLDAFSKFTSQ